MVQIVAYNAASTLAGVLDRIPRDLRARLTEICVFDDASSDDTHLVGQNYKSTRNDMPMLQLFRNPTKQGYGGNQKLGYRYAIEQGFDFLVLLHGDGQYAPEVMPNLLEPLLANEADAVFGSRMMDRGGARRGGMPLYKYLGNKILTRFENAFLDMNLTEFHSGYRAYSVEALKRIPFENNTNDFHFDTQIIIQLKAGGLRIKEVPIPTYYGDEICHVDGIKYARDVARSVMEYRFHRAGLARRPEYSQVPVPPHSDNGYPRSSHARIAEAVASGSRVLDVGCAGGYLARALAAKGCTVFGTGGHPDWAAQAAYARTYVANLDDGTWSPEERDFDYILFADVLEHLRDTSILDRAKDWLRPGGTVIASTGNVALWFMRLQRLRKHVPDGPHEVADETYTRRYTRNSFRQLFMHAGYTVVHEDATVIPFERIAEAIPTLASVAPMLDTLQHPLARRWPELFAFQFVIQAKPSEPTSAPAL